MLSTNRLCLSFAVVMLCSVVALAEKPAKKGVEASAGEIAKLIKQFEADKYSTREAASTRLGEMGRQAVPALAKAAVDENPETSTRAMDLLEKFFASKDNETKDAAKAALEKIAQSGHPSAAGRAQQAIHPEDANAQPAAGAAQGMGQLGGGQLQIVPGGAMPLPNIQIQGGMLQLGVGGGMKSMSMSSTPNGGKKIEASENGRKVKIEDDPKQGITMEVTEQKNGKDVTEKYRAKDADELKKKKPDAYKIYKEYAENQMPGGVQGMATITINGGAQAIPGGAMPAMPALPAMPILPAQPAQPGQGAGKIITGTAALGGSTVATALMKSLGAHVESLTKDKSWKNESTEAKEQLQKQVRELRVQLKELDEALKKD
jgi:hypothetical protein